MGIHDRDYMRDPQPSGQPSARAGKASSGGGGGWRPSMDTGLILGIVLVALGFSALIIKGFNDQRKRDEMLAELASVDPYYNGGYPHYDISTVTEAQLVELPMMTPEIAAGIIKRREEKPFRLTEDLLEIRGVGNLNLEMFRMYLFGFEDAPEPRRRNDRPMRPPDV